jgi:arabinogalactan oligomer/maltooligosaccharide transport system permease protein
MSGIAAFFANLAVALARAARSVPGRLAGFAGRLKDFFSRYGADFKNGGADVRLSYAVMGYGSIKARQLVRGILFLVVEILFIVFMAAFGGKAVAGFFTLGTRLPVTVENEYGITRPLGGDNSLLMLLYGIIAFIIIICFISLYFMSVRSSVDALAARAAGKKPKSFREDLDELLGARLYASMLFIPVLCVIALTVVPIIYMVLMAFTSYDRNHLPPGSLFGWTGFAAFGKMLSLGGGFFAVLGWTLIWAFFATFLNYFAGMIVALLINRKGVRGKKIFRTVFVLTIAVPQFISLLVMRNFLNLNGPLNEFIANAGMQKIDFLGDPRYNGLIPRISVIVVNLWVGIPYTMLITSGILMNIPAELYESGRIDGASPARLFISITLPYILFITSPYLIQQFVGNINNFNLIYLLTEGGPVTLGGSGAGRTDLLITWLYKMTIDEKNYNIGAVIGIFTFLICAVFSLIVYSQSGATKREGEFR